MEEEIPKKYPTLGDYILLKTLGKGYNSKVKLGYHKGTGAHYAVKIIHSQNYIQNLKTIKNEVEIMTKLKHENILNLFEYKENEEYVKTNGQTRRVMYIALELAEGGELFEYVANCGAFSEQVARTYFHQLMEGLSYCHEQGITHRDIKPENLLFDKNFVLKLADFGFSTLLQGKDGSGYNKTILGTESYMAPEIHARQPYKGNQVDLFASAIILFIMYAGTPPFTQATPRDPYYKLIANNKFETFWAAHARYKPKGYYSDQLKDFINKMLAYYPNNRIDFEVIKKHPWYCGPTVTQTEIIKEFQKRKKIVDIELEKERVLKEQQKQKQQQQAQQNLVFTGIGGFRALTDFKEFEGLDVEFPTIEAKRKIYTSETKEKKLQNFYTRVDTEYLWFFVLKKLKECSLNNIQLNKDKYKIICSVMGEFERTDLEIKISEMEDKVIEVDFTKKQGEACKFFDTITKIKEKFSELREKEKAIEEKQEEK